MSWRGLWSSASLVAFPDPSPQHPERSLQATGSLQCLRQVSREGAAGKAGEEGHSLRVSPDLSEPRLS